jgi:hypothetical protein
MLSIGYTGASFIPKGNWKLKTRRDIGRLPSISPTSQSLSRFSMNAACYRNLIMRINLGP